MNLKSKPNSSSKNRVDSLERVDSHQHFWLLSRGDYDWLTKSLQPIYRDFLAKELEPLMLGAGVSKTIIVQAAETNAETDFLLNIAEQTYFVAGVVGWVDMEDINAVERLEGLAKNPLFKGIRPMIQDIQDDQWMLKEQLDPVFQALMELDLRFDALVKPQHLPYLQTLLARYPKLKVVIDHGAKPDIASGQTQQWAKDISEIARNSDAHCKLSGLLNQAGTDPSLNTITHTINHLIDCFGSERLMWGSDWPVINLASTYTQWSSMITTYLSSLDAQSQENIWAKSAQNFYNI